MKKKKSSYIGHSSVYYRGTNPYSLYFSENGSFYSLYFYSLPTIHVYVGRYGCYINGGEVNARMPSQYRDVFIDFLIEDLMNNFGINVKEVL